MTGFHFEAFVNAIVYAVLGIVIFALSFVTIDKLTPHDLWKEIIEDKKGKPIAKPQVDSKARADVAMKTPKMGDKPGAKTTAP